MVTKGLSNEVGVTDIINLGEELGPKREGLRGALNGGECYQRGGSRGNYGTGM